MTIEKKYVIFIIITICWILGTIGLTFNIDVSQGSSKNLELVKLVFYSIGAYGVITATYFTVQNSLESTMNVKARIDFDKLQNSVRFIERWDEPSLKESRDFTRKILQNRQQITDVKLLQDIKDNEELERSLITNLNYWEGMYFVITHDIANENLLKMAFKDTFNRMYKTFEIYIGDTKENHIRLVENLEAFHKRWS